MINLINKNHLLKELYPNGLNSLSISGLNSDFSTVYLKIRTHDMPSVFIKKYGEWGKDYDTLEFDIQGGLVSHVNVDSWNIDCVEECNFAVEKINDDIVLKFWVDDSWSIYLKLKVLLFQSCKAYIKDENDYYPR